MVYNMGLQRALEGKACQSLYMLVLIFSGIRDRATGLTQQALMAKGKQCNPI